MKRILFAILVAVLCVSAFSGCRNSETTYAFFSSYMLTSLDRNDPNDEALAERLLPSEALYAYKIEKTESNTIQTVYVWHNLLRRELRLDILQIYDAVPDKDKDITLHIGDEVRINNKKIEFEPSSELSFSVLRAIFPAEFQVNAKTFRNVLREMIIRLETLDYLGDTEVIAIQTIANAGLMLESNETSAIGIVTEVR